MKLSAVIVVALIATLASSALSFELQEDVGTEKARTEESVVTTDPVEGEEQAVNSLSSAEKDVEDSETKTTTTVNNTSSEATSELAVARSRRTVTDVDTVGASKDKPTVCEEDTKAVASHHPQARTFVGYEDDQPVAYGYSHNNHGYGQSHGYNPGYGNADHAHGHGYHNPSNDHYSHNAVHSMPNEYYGHTEPAYGHNGPQHHGYGHNDYGHQAQGHQGYGHGHMEQYGMEHGYPAEQYAHSLHKSGHHGEYGYNSHGGHMAQHGYNYARGHHGGYGHGKKYGGHAGYGHSGHGYHKYSHQGHGYHGQDGYGYHGHPHQGHYGSGHYVQKYGSALHGQGHRYGYSSAHAHGHHYPSYRFRAAVEEQQEDQKFRTADQSYAPPKASTYHAVPTTATCGANLLIACVPEVANVPCVPVSKGY